MRACERALRVAAGPPLAVLRPLTMGPPWPAGRALPETGLRPLIRRYKVDGALVVDRREFFQFRSIGGHRTVLGLYDHVPAHHQRRGCDSVRGRTLAGEETAVAGIDPVYEAFKIADDDRVAVGAGGGDVPEPQRFLAPSRRIPVPRSSATSSLNSSVT